MAQGVLAADIRPRSGQPHSPQGGVLLTGEPALEMASRHWTLCHPHTCHVRSSPRHNTCHLWERGHRYHHNTQSLWPLTGYDQGPPNLPPPQVSVPHCSTALHARILAFHHHPNMLLSQNSSSLSCVPPSLLPLLWLRLQLLTWATATSHRLLCYSLITPTLEMWREARGTESLSPTAA